MCCGFGWLRDEDFAVLGDLCAARCALKQFDTKSYLHILYLTAQG